MFAYIHIPFCRQKCPYCKFALTPFVQEAKIAAYLGVLCAEIERFVTGLPLGERFDSIYFWGGTPSVLSAPQIETILSRFPKSRRSPDIEITLEANPEDVNELFAQDLVRLGINRISLGVQSLNDETLKEVHRGSKNDVLHTLDSLVGFPNVNVDFILGLPHAKAGQTLADIRTLHERHSNISHTSVYFLEKGDYPKHWIALSASEAEMTEEYAKIADYLVSDRGFRHYEVSNF